MIVLAHRGHWLQPEEQNRPVAFARCFDGGFGTETDLRDRDGALVIAHDMADADAMRLADVVDMARGRGVWLALNIKADGLGPALLAQMRQAGAPHWFTFDMSVPELRRQLDQGLPAFTRASDYERVPALYDRAAGVWVDAFEREWFKPCDIRESLNDGKRVCIVSPELHGRDRQKMWTALRHSGIAGHPALMLCTDHPVQAAAFFGTACVAAAA